MTSTTVSQVLVGLCSHMYRGPQGDHLCVPFPFPVRAPLNPMQSTGAVILGVCAEEFGRLVGMAPVLAARWEEYAAMCGSQVQSEGNASTGAAAVQAVAGAGGSSSGCSAPHVQGGLAAAAPAASGSSGPSRLLWDWNHVSYELHALLGQCWAACGVHATMSEAMRSLRAMPGTSRPLFAPDWGHVNFARLLVCAPMVALAACAQRTAAERGVSAEDVFEGYVAAVKLPDAVANTASGATSALHDAIDDERAEGQRSAQLLKVWELLAWAEAALQACQGCVAAGQWFNSLKARIQACHPCPFVDYQDARHAPPQKPAPALSMTSLEYLDFRDECGSGWLECFVEPMLRAAADQMGREEVLSNV